VVITGLSITISFRSRKNRIGCERRIDISRFTVYPQQWESYYKIYEGMNTRKIILAGTMSVDEYFDELIDKVQEDYENMRCESVMTHV
jgi:hypothetical protein